MVNTTYKIKSSSNKITYIHEFWDDILIFTYTVYAEYKGGNIEEFMRENPMTRIPDFDGIREFHRRTFILESY